MFKRTKEKILKLIEDAGYAKSRDINDVVFKAGYLKQASYDATITSIVAGIQDSLALFVNKETFDDTMADMEKSLLPLATRKELLEDKNFISDLAKAVEVQHVMNLSKVRERKLEEFTEKELEMENSSEPWCDVMVVGTDAEKGVALRTGWNSAFIKYLKDNGFTGEDEERIVQGWIGRLGIESLLDEYEET